jgi:hypothetical protein
MADKSKQLGDKIGAKMQSYRNIRRAYNTLENTYMTIRNINHISDLAIYIQQLEAFLTVQEAVMDRLEQDAVNTDMQLKGVKDINQIEIILGL